MVFRHVVPKAKLLGLQPLPEPVEEMAVEVEETPVSFHSERLLETHVTASMLSALQLGGTARENSAPSLSREESFDDVFG
jgi:putative heme iron utilization protein